MMRKPALIVGAVLVVFLYLCCTCDVTYTVTTAQTTTVTTEQGEQE